ncbi:hypothetical protein AB9F39_38595, partial [Rhizobium leguminosarum]
AKMEGAEAGSIHDPAFFHLRLPRADAVIWLRLPRYACLYGAVSRTYRYFGRNRPELPAGCPERLSLDALAYIWNFERGA